MVLATFLTVLALFSLFCISRRVDRAESQTASPDAQHGLLLQHEDIDTDGDVFQDDQDEFGANFIPAQAGSAVQPVLPSARVSMPVQCPPDSHNDTVAAKYAKYPNLLRDAMLYSGSGQDLVRVLGRAKRLSRDLSQKAQPSKNTDAFRVMVIGGSGRCETKFRRRQIADPTYLYCLQFRIVEELIGPSAGTPMLCAGCPKPFRLATWQTNRSLPTASSISPSLQLARFSIATVGGVSLFCGGSIRHSSGAKDQISLSSKQASTTLSHQWTLQASEQLNRTRRISGVSCGS